MLFSEKYVQRLTKLLSIDTVTPMETSSASCIAQANDLFIGWATSLGMELVFCGPGNITCGDPMVPKKVNELCLANPDFLAWQPHAVLAVGNGSKERTLMFNFHMDTVSPHLPAYQQDDCVYGRGAVDNKGPGLAVLAAIEEIINTHPEILHDMRLIIQVVSGEEGGAMGVFGTRYLCEQGHCGVLNVFVEPTGDGYFDASTTSMTFEIRMDGKGSTDDFPERADNASLIIAFIAQEMAQQLSAPLSELNVKMTLAGIHTGLHHNRVYGSGYCLFNFSYRSAEIGLSVADLVEDAYSMAISRFNKVFSNLHPFSLSSERLHATCSARWLKRNLPVLNNRSPAMEQVLSAADIHRHSCNSQAFTCDAMWAQKDDAYSVVWGPGSLAENGAHTADEHVRLKDLESYTRAVHKLIINFSRCTSETSL